MQRGETGCCWRKIIQLIVGPDKHIFYRPYRGILVKIVTAAAGFPVPIPRLTRIFIPFPTVFPQIPAKILHENFNAGL